MLRNLIKRLPDAFTVDVTLAGVTATGGAAPLAYPHDYDNFVTRLNFSGTAGETQQFTVATLDDGVVELAETFTVSLIASNSQIDSGETSTGTIVDNDRATLSVSDDGDRLVIGAPTNDGSSAGQSRAYRFDGILWIQLGQNT